MQCIAEARLEEYDGATSGLLMVPDTFSKIILKTIERPLDGEYRQHSQLYLLRRLLDASQMSVVLQRYSMQ